MILTMLLNLQILEPKLCMIQVNFTQQRTVIFLYNTRDNSTQCTHMIFLSLDFVHRLIEGI